jgi:hypothetical protein
MKEWCMVHPYLTTLLAILMLLILDNVLANVARILGTGRKS